MPIHDWLCTQCGWQQELIRKTDATVNCDACGAPAQKLVSAGSFKFKGRVVQGGGPDRFTADVLGIPLKDLPKDLKVS